MSVSAGLLWASLVSGLRALGSGLWALGRVSINLSFVRPIFVFLFVFFLSFPLTRFGQSRCVIFVFFPHTFRAENPPLHVSGIVGFMPKTCATSALRPGCVWLCIAMCVWAVVFGVIVV